MLEKPYVPITNGKLEDGQSSSGAFGGLTAKRCEAINNQCHVWMREGAAARDNGSSSLYFGGTIAHSMFTKGWLIRDMQLALCLASSKYMTDQVLNGLVSMELLELEAKRRGMEKTGNEKVY
jgi:hypothetical protein